MRRERCSTCHGSVCVYVCITNCSNVLDSPYSTAHHVYSHFMPVYIKVNYISIAHVYNPMRFLWCAHIPFHAQVIKVQKTQKYENPPTIISLNHQDQHPTYRPTVL